jgi:uncharacterized protein
MRRRSSSQSRRSKPLVGNAAARDDAGCAGRERVRVGHHPAGSVVSIVQAWLTSTAFELVVSETVLAEVEDLLGRPRLRKWVTPEDTGAFPRAIRVAADLVADRVERLALTRDPDDDYLIALARAHDADMIVSGDKDLLTWPEQRPPVVTPAAFERMLAAS